MVLTTSDKGRHMRKLSFKIWTCLILGFSNSGCVQGGTGGARSNFVSTSAGSLSERREALRSVAVVTAKPAGMQLLGEIETDRCHRYFTEAPPNEASLVNDLKFAAFGQGADALRIVEIRSESALTSNCWYLLRGRAEIYAKQ